MISPGEPAPDFTLRREDGNTFTPEDLQSNKPYSREPITGLQAQAKARRA